MVRCQATSSGGVSTVEVEEELSVWAVDEETVLCDAELE